MAKYKIIKIYVVEAANRIEARSKFVDAHSNNKEDEYLEHISIKEADTHTNGWKDSLKQQLTGSKH
jgi:hypothetical protein